MRLRRLPFGAVAQDAELGRRSKTMLPRSWATCSILERCATVLDRDRLSWLRQRRYLSLTQQRGIAMLRRLEVCPARIGQDDVGRRQGTAAVLFRRIDRLDHQYCLAADLHLSLRHRDLGCAPSLAVQPVRCR